MKETASGNDQQLEMILPHNVGLNSFDSKLSVQRRTSGRNIALRGCTIPPKPDAMGRSLDQLRDASPPGGARGPVSPQSGPAGPGACPSGAELTQGVGREERRLLRCLRRRAPPPRCALPLCASASGSPPFPTREPRSGQSLALLLRRASTTTIP